MKPCLGNCVVVLCGFLTLLKTVEGILCYQCNNTQLVNPFQCNEFFEDTDMQPTTCDNVYGAKFCIKQIGRFEVAGIRCFQCSSSFNISCTDLLISDGVLQPEECDHVFEAEYCIKTTGRGAGGIGTKRYCSSLDMGNYCNNVQQPGDVLMYRSCMYTCQGDGCNSATTLRTYLSLPILIPALFWFL